MEGITSSNKKTIYVGGLSDVIDEGSLVEVFSTFGDIIEVQIPPAATNPNIATVAPGHRGFAFISFSSAADAQDAIDNMDLNELRGRVLRVNLARPMKGPVQGAGNRAVWDSEEWLQTHAKPVAAAGIGSKAPGAQRGTTPSAEEDGAGEDVAMEE